MSQHWARDVAHVVWSREVSPANGGQRFCAQQQRDRGARAGAIMRRRMIAGAPHYVNDITLHARFDAHGANFRAATRDGIGFTQRLYVDLIEPARIEACVPTRDDLMLFVSGG